MAKLDGTNGLIQQYDYQVLTTAFSYTFAAGTQTLIINPAGTLATGTVTMPPAPADGMVIWITTTKQIVALTINGNTGQTLTSGVTSLAPNQAVAYLYRSSNTTWYPFETQMAQGNGPAFSVYRSSTQSFSSATWTKIQYNTENYDTANCYDNSTNHRFTPNVAGYYIFMVSVNLGGSSNPTTCGVGLFKNGTQYRYGPVNYFTWTVSGSMVGTYGAYMNGTTDYVEGVVYSNGTSPSANGDSSQSVFEGYLVRTA